MPVYHYKQARTSEKVRQLVDSNTTSSYQLVGRITPSGRLTVGRVPIKKVIQDDIQYERTRVKTEFYKRLHWHYREGLITETLERTIEPEQLGLSSVSNCHKDNQPRRHGLKGISPNGRKVVREACYLLERRYKKRLGFYTLTCPYTDLQSVYSYNKDIAYIQRSFFQELKREYERKGCQWSYCSVLEIQPKRFERDGVPVLHIHYVAPCYLPNSYTWILTASEIRVLWGRVLRNCLGQEPNTGASIDAAVIRSTAVGYISKYFSKSNENLGYIAEICPDQLPSQWWSTSRNVRACIEANICTLPLAVCHSFIGGYYGDCVHPDDVLYLRNIYVFWNTEVICVGLSADIAQRSADSLRPFSEWQKMYGYL